MDRITIRVPLKIKQELQIIAIQKKTSMNQIVTDLILEYINKNKPS